MNLLTIDASAQVVKFAVFATTPVLVPMLTGEFERGGASAIHIRDEAGTLLTSVLMPAAKNLEARLSWVLQWLDSRQIRIDAMAHRTIGATDDGSSRGAQYLQAAYAGLPHANCCIPNSELVDLAAVAAQALTPLALPLSCPNIRSIQVRCPSCSAA